MNEPEKHRHFPVLGFLNGCVDRNLKPDQNPGECSSRLRTCPQSMLAGSSLRIVELDDPVCAGEWGVRRRSAFELWHLLRAAMCQTPAGPAELWMQKAWPWFLKPRLGLDGSMSVGKPLHRAGSEDLEGQGSCRTEEVGAKSGGKNRCLLADRLEEPFTRRQHVHRDVK